MSLRWRLAVILATTVAVTVTVVSLAAYAIARAELLAETDRSLAARANDTVNALRREPDRSGTPDLDDLFGGRRGGRRPAVATSDVVLQMLDEHGTVVATVGGGPVLGVSDQDRRIAADADRDSHPDQSGPPAPVVVDAVIDGDPYRLLTTPIPGYGALQVASEVSGTAEVLAGLRARMLAAGGLATVVAAAVGWLVAGRTVRPVEQLTAAAEHVAATQQLDTAIETQRGDEVGRLAESFNQMLSALRESRAQQQRLVQDAGHELRTPLTSLRTNAAVLAQVERLSPEDRAKLVGDVSEEVQELSDLVAELVVLAQAPDAADELEAEVDLTDLAETAAERARRRTHRRVGVTSPPAPVVLRGRAGQLDRAITNLMTNAAKFSPAGTPIDLAVRVQSDGVALTVRDRGPGIAATDRPYVFDRFYRADSARAEPGSGLGLAIVDQVVRDHDGTVTVEDAPGGGAVVGFVLPRSRLVDPAAGALADPTGDTGSAPGRS